MTGRTLFSHQAAQEDKRAKTLGEIERPRRAVSLLEQDLGQGVTRVEIVTNGDHDGDYWPALHAFPDDIAADLLKVARRWLAERDDVELVATSAWVDRSKKPIVCIFALHIVSRAEPVPAREAAAPAACGARPLTPSRPDAPPATPPAHCQECGG